MRKILKSLLNHERYEIISIAVCIALMVWHTSCEPKTPSLIDPSLQITRQQMNQEIDILITKANFADADLAKQEELRDYLFNQAILYGQTGTINPIGLLTSLGTIFGIGAVTDNVRKRKKLKELESTT